MTTQTTKSHERTKSRGLSLRGGLGLLRVADPKGGPATQHRNQPTKETPCCNNVASVAQQLTGETGVIEGTQDDLSLRRVARVTQHADKPNGEAGLLRGVCNNQSATWPATMGLEPHSNVSFVHLILDTIPGM